MGILVATLAQRDTISCLKSGFAKKTLSNDMVGKQVASSVTDNASISVTEPNKVTP